MSKPFTDYIIIALQFVVIILLPLAIKGSEYLINRLGDKNGKEKNCTNKEKQGN